MFGGKDSNGREEETEEICTGLYQQKLVILRCADRSHFVHLKV